MCGEKTRSERLSTRASGSPPRVRGKVVHRPWRRLRLGITPAYAGKSRSQPRLPCTGRDHPRMCGEKFSSRSSADLRHGSPPHVRGKGCPRECAWPLGEDHPRVCGEKCQSWAHSACRMGSPPHVRGKVCCACLYDLIDGITPAYAGKRTRHPWCVRDTGDHPRACGEKAVGLDHQVDILGSPPRVRGKEGGKL